MLKLYHNFASSFFCFFLLLFKLTYFKNSNELLAKRSYGKFSKQKKVDRIRDTSDEL